MSSQSEKDTLFQTNVLKMYTFFRQKQLKNHVRLKIKAFGAAHTSDSPYRGVIPTPPAPEPKAQFLFERLIRSFYSLFFQPFLATRDKILSSDHRATEK